MALIDEQIKDAMRKGQFDDLPGAGKPFKLDDDANVPETLRMAHKLLRDNDLVPDWIAQGQELDAARATVIAAIQRAARDYRGVLGDAARSRAPELERQKVERGWQASLAVLRESVRKHNSQVLSYNLKVPTGVTHKRHLDFDAELAKTR